MSLQLSLPPRWFRSRPWGRRVLWLGLVGLAAIACLWGAVPASAQNPLPREQYVTPLELVYRFEENMPTGVTVSQENRLFVNFPRWGDDVPFTVAEITAAGLVPYPDAELNVATPEAPAESLLSVQSVVVDPANRLWLLDTGSIEFGETSPGGPKLVGVDLETDTVFATITLPPEVALPTTYLNDVRFDLRQGEAGVAYITDSSLSGPNALIVVDLASGRSWRRLNEHPSTTPIATFLPFVEGQPLKSRPPNGGASPFLVGADGIALSADGDRLFYCPLSSRRLYSVSTAALRDETLDDAAVAETVTDLGEKGVSDGLAADTQNRVYTTDFEHNALHRRSPDGSVETLVHDPRLLWPDTLALAGDGYLYVTSNQLHRQPNFHRGEDQREYPYSLFRLPVEAAPVRLR